MPTANTRRDRRTRRAAKRRAGTFDARDESDQARVAATEAAPPQSPLDFAQSVFRDPAQPMALRASLAKAALPYTHARRSKAESGPRDADARLPRPFDKPDPYASLRVDWRDALEQAGLIAPLHDAEATSTHEAGGVLHARTPPGVPQRVEDARKRAYGTPSSPEGEGEERSQHDALQQRLRETEERERAAEARRREQDAREQRIERDPYDPHPGYRWIR